MKKLLLFVFAFTILSVLNTEAQVNIGKIKNKVKDKVNDEKTKVGLGENETSDNKNQTTNTGSQVNGKKNDKDPFAPVKDNGMTDAIHANHLKQIVFSKTSIEYKKGKEEQLTNKFNLGDEIYIMAYFDRSMKNQWLKDKVEMPDKFITFVNIWYEVNGQVVGKEGANSFEKRHYGLYPYEFSEWTAVCYPLLSLSKCENFNRDNIQLPFHSYVVPLLKQGENKVKMFMSFEAHEDMDPDHGSYSGDLKKELKLIYQPAEPMAVGEMTITVKNIADVKKMLTQSGFIPVAAQNNPALEKQIMNIYNTNNSESKAVKAFIYDSDWTVRRDDYGNILGRYVGVKLVVTTSDPNFYQVWDKSAEQPYTGGGNYSNKIVLSNYTTPSYIISSSLFK